MRKHESMFWPVVAMLLGAALIVVWVLAWSEPWDGWNAFGAIFTAAGAMGTAAAAWIALRIGKAELAWRHQQKEERRRLAVVYVKSILTMMMTLTIPIIRLKDLIDNWNGQNDDARDRILSIVEGLAQGFSSVDTDRLA